jgi:hypothetical protein
LEEQLNKLQATLQQLEKEEQDMITTQEQSKQEVKSEMNPIERVY